MSTISVKAHFAAGHRILGLSGPGEKCRNIHGHTFHVTWVFAQDSDLEFGTLKAALRELIKRDFDHGFIHDKADDFCVYLAANMLKHYPLDGPPTTEAIAAELAARSIERLHKPYSEWGTSVGAQEPLYPHARLLKLILDEGPENSATWEPEPVNISTIPFIHPIGSGITT